MSRRRKYRKRRGLFGPKLKNNTIYSLFGLFLLATGGALLASYAQKGEILSKVHVYGQTFFGQLVFLAAAASILLSLLFLRIKLYFTKPSFVMGFLVFVTSVFGLTQAGVIGRELYNGAFSIIGEPFTMIVFLLGAIVGFMVFVNLSPNMLLSIFGTVVSALTTFLKNNIAPFFKTRKILVVKEMKPLAIKDMRDKAVSSVPEPKVTRATLDNSQKALKGDHLREELILNKPLQMGVWEYPPLALISEHHDKKAERGDIKKIATLIEKTLESFGVQARVTEINVGPSVTQYAIEIALGTKLSKITALANDLALATEAPTGQVRIEAPIPGRNLVGIEIPNKSLELVSLKTMLQSSQLQKARSKLAVPLGLDVSGTPVIADLAKMPHVLIAGTTGSGKSVLINAFIASLLFRASPSEVRFIMIDPKRVELTGYNQIPHLLVPVVVEPTQAVSALKWALKEMDRRYIKFAESGVKNIDSYNELAGFQALPYIIIFIDELADLMALAAVEVEDSVARLAQMARATGIHLVLSTQRPSVDVITGLIKANIPCRIAFNVSSMVDSKVIIDTPGAEKLLGRGDMLYVPPDQAKPTRIQGAFVSEGDVKRLVNFIKARGIPVEYTQEVVEQEVNLKRGGMGTANIDGGDERDPLFEQAVRIVCQYDRASSSLLQRRLSIGFNRAARILEQLEAKGIVGAGEGSKPREVLIKNAEEYLSQQ